MYQALYRKYRPKTFDDVVGQDVIKTTIINSIKNDNLSHAYLFCGPRGTGKTSIAKLIAKLVNCSNSIEGKPCGECKFCKESITNDLDLIEIDAASNNGVDEIRELKNKINIMPNLGKYKIYIIDEVHMLSIGAFNALLKTLEEPPKHVIFILATTEVNKIPETIISRCQSFDFKRVNESDIIKRLKHICEKENIKVKNDVLDKIALLSNGGLRDAIGLLDKVYCYNPAEVIDIKDLNNVAYLTRKEDIEELINCIQMFDINNYLKLINALYNQGKDMVSLVNELIIYSRDCLLNNLEKYDKEFLLNIVLELNNLAVKMKNSPYPKILLEIFIIRINKDKQIEKKNKSTTISKENKNISRKINTFDELKFIRINNTLCEANKEFLTSLKNKWKEINFSLLDNKYNEMLSFIPDLNIVAASDKNILFSSKYDSIISNALEHFILVEDFIKDFYKKSYKVMLIDNNEWNKIKKDYIDRTKNNMKYSYVEENINIKEICKGEMIK